MTATKPWRDDPVFQAVAEGVKRGEITHQKAIGDLRSAGASLSEARRLVAIMPTVQ